MTDQDKKSVWAYGIEAQQMILNCYNYVITKNGKLHGAVAESSRILGVHKEDSASW